ncbi:unnamed protein product [Somion occarium]|uniref:Uncharacterized protein n=1 Tax=Somion occarium TaxID=3059160 RepID=A0ABP1DA08_9APHY
MSNDIELDVLSSSRPTEQTTEDAASAGPDITSNGEDQVVTLWAYVSTALLSSLAILMILFPGVLLFSAETPSEHRTTLTSLESYLALNGGIMLLAFSMALLFNIPSNEPIVETETQSSKGHPLLVPLTVACTVIAFLSYNTTTVSSLAFLIFLGAAIIGGWGWWTVRRVYFRFYFLYLSTFLDIICWILIPFTEDGGRQTNVPVSFW